MVRPRQQLVFRCSLELPNHTTTTSPVHKPGQGNRQIGCGIFRWLLHANWRPLTTPIPLHQAQFSVNQSTVLPRVAASMFSTKSRVQPGHRTPFGRDKVQLTRGIRYPGTRRSGQHLGFDQASLARITPSTLPAPGRRHCNRPPVFAQCLFYNHTAYLPLGLPTLRLSIKYALFA